MRGGTSSDVGFPQAPFLADAALSKMMEGMTGGAILAGLAVHLGASDPWVGAIAAILLFAQLAQFAAYAHPRQVRDRKRASLSGALASRVALGLAGLAALLTSAPVGLALLTILLAIASVFSATSAIAWACWIRDLVPAAHLGRVFARRLIAQALGGAVGILASGLVLTAAPLEWRGRAFAGLFVGGCVLGLAGLLAARRVPAPPWNPAEASVTMRPLLARFWRGKDTRPVIIFAAAWGLASGLGLPFLAIYLLREIGLSFASVAVLSLASLASGVLATVAWGRWTDRAGSKVVLGACLPLVTVSFLALAWLPPDPNILLIIHIALGVAVAGVEVATARLVSRRAPFTGGAGLLAAAAVARAVISGAACLLAGAMAALWADLPLSLAAEWNDLTISLEMGRYELLFFASAIGTLFAWHRALAFVEPEGSGRNIPHELMIDLHALSSLRPVRALGHLATHLARHDEETRGSEIRSSRS